MFPVWLQIPTILFSRPFCNIATPPALWRGVKGLTPIALSWKKDTHFTETSVVNFPVCVFVRRANFNFVFGDTIFQTSRFHGAMCFASVSIFGNKFLTPVGMKTLFPIFENTLCGKVLAVKTLALFKRERWTFGFFQQTVFPI